jgi:ABC-2 type transport system permease protein
MWHGSPREPQGASEGEIMPVIEVCGLTKRFGKVLAVAVMGVTVSSGEFRHATATLTYLATPRRGRVLTAKVVAGACAGAVFGLVG